MSGITAGNVGADYTALTVCGGTHWRVYTLTGNQVGGHNTVTCCIDIWVTCLAMVIDNNCFFNFQTGINSQLYLWTNAYSHQHQLCVYSAFVGLYAGYFAFFVY